MTSLVVSCPLSISSLFSLIQEPDALVVCPASTGTAHFFHSSVERDEPNTRRARGGREPRGRGARERVLVRSGCSQARQSLAPFTHHEAGTRPAQDTQIASLAAYRHPPPTPLPQKRTRRTPPQAAELRQLRPAVARHTSPASASRSSAAAPPTGEGHWRWDSRPAPLRHPSRSCLDHRRAAGGRRGRGGWLLARFALLRLEHRREAGVRLQKLRLERAVGARQVDVPQVAGGARVVIHRPRHLPVSISPSTDTNSSCSRGLSGRPAAPLAATRSPRSSATTAAAAPPSPA